jgi:chromate transporter
LRPRYLVFLRDVLWLSITAFGGPQAHLAYFLDLFVERRRYLTEKELIELNALCNILPGATSTQTISAIGFRLGGPNLAYLALIVWMLPAFLLMTFAALAVTYLQHREISLSFMRFVQPMAVGFVAYSAYRISQKVVSTGMGVAIMVLSALISYFFRSPWVFPALLLAGGAITASQYRSQPRVLNKQLTINWANFVLWAAVLVTAAVAGALTRTWDSPFVSQAIRLFENFYRNGSIIFGGGQVLVPLIYTEFVEFKHQLSSSEFLSGIAIVQTLPGPVFSFCAYVGALAMREHGLSGQLLGAFIATAGIFLPGTFLIFFVIRFWEQLKQYRIVKSSLEGINAVGAGLVAASAILLFHPLEHSTVNWMLVIGTFAVLQWTKLPPALIIGIGLVAGIIVEGFGVKI